MYKLIKPLLFCLSPEAAHAVTLSLLDFAHKTKLTKLFSQPIKNPCTIMGITFPNPIGLAAGLDKSGDHIDALATLGFGFLEIGTVTPKPQTGNPKPRLFRLADQQAIINRMGFNNQGCDYLVTKLQKCKYRGILGINIGKNSATPIAQAAEDYVTAWRAVAPYASYITVNISSPNTQSLRDLQHADFLPQLLKKLKAEQANSEKYVPLVVKIAPDLIAAELKTLAEIVLAEKVDGVIATNTSVQRVGVEASAVAQEAGGLSGAPLTPVSTDIIQQLSHLLGAQIPIIASGGVMNAADAHAKINAGAALVQLYTGLIYHGPGLIRKLLT